MFSATAKDNISNDTKAGVNRIKEDVRNTIGDVRNTAGEARADLEAVASNAGRKVRQYFDDASEEISDAADAVKTQIRKNPIQSSILALTTGFILGSFLRSLR